MDDALLASYGEPLLSQRTAKLECQIEKILDELASLKKVKCHSPDADFANKVSLMGLSDAIKSRHVLIKTVWILVFALCLIATTYFVYNVFNEYKNEPTATEVQLSRNASYSFPPIVLCVDTWLNASKTAEMGFSTAGTRYAMSFIGDSYYSTNQADVAGDFNKSYPPFQEFSRIYARYNFSHPIDFLKFISLDAIASYGGHDESRISWYQFNHGSSNFRPGEILEKTSVNGLMCYKLSLPSADNSIHSSKTLFLINVPDVSNGLCQREQFWHLYIDPPIKYSRSIESSLKIQPDDYIHTITIKSQRIYSLNTRKNPCINRPNYYTKRDCELTCKSNAQFMQLGCRLLENEYNTQHLSHPPIEYCRNDGVYVSTDESVVEVSEKILSECIANCSHDCVQNLYEPTMEKQLTVRDTTGSETNDTILKRHAYIVFANKNGLSGGVLTFKEVRTYSFETLISNIGGSLGIWIGASILTIMQLFMYALELCLDSISKRTRKNTCSSRTETKCNVKEEKRDFHEL